MIPVFSNKTPKPGRKPPRLAVHSAYLQGLLFGAKLIDRFEAQAVMARCDHRAEKAFAIGALQRGTKILPEGEIEAAVDRLCGECTCDPKIWHRVPAVRRRHAVACPHWRAPAEPLPA